MKAIFLLAGMLMLAGNPAKAGPQVFVNLGGGYRGSCLAATGSRCAYSAGFIHPCRLYGYIGYPGYSYGGCGYSYGGYTGSYYPVSYDSVAYGPTYVEPVPGAAPSPAAPAPVSAPSPSSAPALQAQLPFGILDVNGFVHSPYSDALLKVPGVRNAQMVYDPVTGKPFLVR